VITLQQPWVVAVQADIAGADERDRLSRLLQAEGAGHPDQILLSTCHRVELYGFGPIPQLDASLKVERGESAVRHLFRVATGLESAIVGEDEVLHQVREALSNASTTRWLNGRLQRLFQTAIAAGRRARAKRTAASGNLAQRAVAWLQQRSNFAGHSVLIVGAGRMGSSLAHSARQAGADITIASRDAARACRLAQQYGVRGTNLAAACELALESVAVAVALGGVWHEFQPQQHDLPPIADISAPPAVPRAIRARLDGGFLGIDDLYTRSLVPSAYIDYAVRIVDAKADEYVRWLEGRG
jgi:glutamyl-tRNA reductase